MIVEDIIPDGRHVVLEPIFEGSRQQEAKKSSLIEIVEATEENHEVETSPQNSRETLTSQSSPPSPQHDSFKNTGSVEEDHEVETPPQNSRETLTSQSSESPSPQQINMSFNNTSSGVMINGNIANNYKTTIKNVGNNNSVNYYCRS